MILGRNSCRDFYPGATKPGSTSFAGKETVSRETVRQEMNSYSFLLTNTKIAKYGVEDMFHVNAAEQPSQSCGCSPQILRDELLSLLGIANAVLQQFHCLPQQLPMPLPADQAALARTKIIQRKCNQRRDQLWDAITPARRDSKIGAACLSHRALRRHRLITIKYLA